MTSCGGSGGSPSGVGDFQVHEYRGGNQSLPAVIALQDGSIVIAWQSVGQDGDGFGVFGRLFSSTLEPRDSEFQLNDRTVGDQQINGIRALNDGGFVVSWTEDDGETYARHFHSDGVPAGASFTIVDGVGDAFSIDGYGRFVVVSEAYGPGLGDGPGRGSSYDYLKGWRTDAFGEPETQIVQLTDYADTFEFDFAEQFSPVVVTDDVGRFVVAWSQTDFYDGHRGSNGENVYASRFDENMVSDGQPTWLGGNTGRNVPDDLATNPAGDFVVTWSFSTGFDRDYDYYEDEEDAHGVVATTVTPENERRRWFEKEQPRYGGAHLDADAKTSMNEIGEFVVVWERHTEDVVNVYAEAFRSDGSVSMPERDVSANERTNQRTPDTVMLSDGAFIVVWADEGSDGDGAGVFARRFLSED